MDDRDLITSREFADLIGKSPSYVCRLARAAKKAKYPWPIKRSNKKTLPWEAPVDEWNNIVHLFSNKRSQKQEVKPTPVSKKELYSITEAVEEIKNRLGEDISIRWLSILGRRNLLLGRAWPQKRGQQRVAPIDEWIRIMRDESLRAWTRKYKNFS